MINSLRDAIQALEGQGLLHHVKAEVDRTWELSAIMRWVYQGYPEDRRYAVMFDKVRGYDIPVVVGVIGGSYKTYATCLGIDPHGPHSQVIGEIRKRWGDALDNPIRPMLLSTGPCKENILKGKEVNIHKFPIPVWTPEKDRGAAEGYGFITSPYHITKDPETGIVNVGTYRNMIRPEPNLMGQRVSRSSHLWLHIKKNEERGRATEIATVIGCDPVVGMASVTRIPYGMDEFTVAGGLRGEPIPLVKCETVDLEVPADAEIVIEGRLPTRQERPYEPEAPFGEYPGYQGFGTYAPVYEITCITHRNKPVYQAFISQLAPSESSKVRHIAHEATYMRDLKAMGIEGIVDMHHPEMTQGAVSIVSIKKRNDGHPALVASALFSLFRGGKFVIITDDDVDIHDLDNVLWAMTFRTSMIPGRRRVYFVENLLAMSADYASANSMEDAQRKEEKNIGCVVIDATRPFAPYPTVALPAAKYLQRARDAWDKTGLPPLVKSELPKCIVVEEEYLKKGLAANPAFLPRGPIE